MITAPTSKIDQVCTVSTEHEKKFAGVLTRIDRSCIFVLLSSTINNKGHDMTTTTNYEAKVYSALVKIAGEHKANVLMALNFELFAKRFGFAQATKCAKEIFNYGDHTKPTDVERWYL